MVDGRFLVFRWVLRMLRLGANADDNDLEIAVLRHQLAILQRQVPRPRYHDSDRRLLAALAKHLPRERWAVVGVTPATLLRWQRQRVGRHWTQPLSPARRRLSDDTVALVLRLARENPRWGYVRIAGECAKVGTKVSATSVRNVRGPPPPRAGPLEATGRPGRSSFAARPEGSWPAISSASTRSACSGCTFCSSSNSTAAGGGWPLSPPTPTATGSPRPPGTCR